MAQHSKEEKMTLADVGKTLSSIIQAHPHRSEYWREMARSIERNNTQALVRELEEEEEGPYRDRCVYCGDHRCFGECGGEG